MKRIVTILLFLSITISLFIPFAASAEEENTDESKVVRVGWYDSSFCYFDKFGRRCGIDYEYQQKISAYTGWTFEYVEDSWPNLFQKLQDGEIDLLSDVSYKPEREEFMLYPDLPMGTESYYIYVDAGNREITADNLKSFNGKHIGVNKGSIQESFLSEWAERNGISLEIVPLTCEENESLEMVVKGEIDGYAAIFSYYFEEKLIPVYRIGSSDYYYAVNKNRPDLLEDLNMALAEIQDEDPYFNQKITEDRLYNSRMKALLTPVQEDWVKGHGPIKIGYRDNYLPFCDKDNDTGELTGALKDFLSHAENILSDSDVEFEAISYGTIQDAIDALKAGKIDCVFPVCLSSYDAEQLDIRLTNPAMKTEMNALMRASDTQRLSKDSEIIFAINEGMINIMTFIMEEYPNSSWKTYDGIQSCYKAVSDGKADCVLVSSYRIPSSEEVLKKYKLYSVPTGEAMSFSFATKEQDTELYFLLNKIVLTTKSEEMDFALASYMRVDQKVTLMQFLKDNMLVIVAVIFVVFFIIIFLLVQKMKADRTAARQKQLLDEAEGIAELKQTVSSLLDNMPGMNFTKDAETGVYLACNQAFAEYAHKKDPSEVVGHTPDQLFDEATAKHFVEDDRVALSMDEAYIYYENVTDADGNQRQMKTTKLKYTDANGRLCVLGVFLDVTDNLRISRDKATTKESYEKARNSGIIFTHIAQTLARGYLELYYIDLNTEEYIQYRTNHEDGSLAELSRGWHFFEQCVDEAEEYVFPEDRKAVIEAMDRKTLVAALDQNNTFVTTFRLIGDPEPRYVSMKVTRMQDDERFIILGITDVDEQMKEHNAAAKMREEKTAYNRINALAGDYLCVFIVMPETGQYREFSAASGFEGFERREEGQDFFADAREEAEKVVFPDDQNRFITALTRENVLGEVESNGIFTLSYRLMINDEPRYVQLKAAMVEEEGGKQLIIGINDIDVQVRMEEEYGRRLAQARIEANIDALTGVKNRNAYRVYEDRLNAQIEVKCAPEFAIVILDLNDLKKVNDNLGHKAGDQYLRDACKIICTTFKRSPVFRVGGDEFAVLSQGEDYAHIYELVEQMNRHNEEAIENGGIVIAVGMARYENDPKVVSVYERADQTMYENKSDLKARKKKG